MDLKETFQHMTENEGWDSESFNSATDLLNILTKSQFLFLLSLYKDIYIDHLFAIFQHKVSSDINMYNNKIKKTKYFKI